MKINELYGGRVGRKLSAPLFRADNLANCFQIEVTSNARILDSLRDMTPSVEIDPAVADRARRSVERMLELS